MSSADVSPAAPVPSASLVPDVVLTAAGLGAQLSEEHCRLPGETADALRDAGFARHFVPRCYGGSEGTFAEFLSATATVAAVCASTAWCAALFAAHGRLASYLPERARQELWGAGPDVRIAASVIPPQGRATAGEGGWRLDGSWSYASGIDHAEWVLLAGFTEGTAGKEHRIFAVPRAEVTVLDTWRPLGLRGTGSNSVRADGVFVPEYRTFTLDRLLRPLPGGGRCHGVPFPMVAALQFAAPLLGAAEAAQSLWTAATAGRRRVDGRAAALTPAARHLAAESSAKIKAARLLLAEVAHRADTAEATPAVVAECRRDAAMAAALCAEAVDRLFHAAGAGALAEGNPLQQKWRDVTAAAAHATLSFDTAAAAYADAVFPDPEEPGPVGPDSDKPDSRKPESDEPEKGADGS
ncbi:acyl-CoA dehydrogenase family protein [Streptomyces sp. VNUA116]|uniref:acyl-CoA dehydrogenase family protein n=1 Tax=Streptomyces sp. VNUA116 TaxID=3062449 RepID=UPI0026762418|nr:acyl-CoA dehydrogenase family protein [Streptomyces sp. VNUA116]WKU46062.1 acyl-CoA dehydrogenase family protein [Streptomyces sp. VNUA116]